jgi:hypothetical protein
MLVSCGMQFGRSRARVNPALNVACGCKFAIIATTQADIIIETRKIRSRCRNHLDSGNLLFEIIHTFCVLPNETMSTA